MSTVASSTKAADPLPATALRPGPSAQRLPFLDFLRATASQLIVLHHLAFYGPLSAAAYPAAPSLLEWLAQHARMAVQLFFVLGGFLTARGLGHGKPLSTSAVGRAVWARYRRIGFPYLATLAVAIAANALASKWMTHESISAPPTLGQLLAHAAFLHDILGYPALTAGIWYLAIDFQLFLLCYGVFWGSQAFLRRFMPGTGLSATSFALLLLASLALASLFWFNREPKYDAWAIYFQGSYFLGVLVHEVIEGRVRLGWGIVYWVVAIGAAILDPRPRLLVAAGTTLIVYLAARTGILQEWPKNRVIGYAGRTSYSLFLIHFPVLLVVNAWGASRLVASTGLAMTGLLVAYGLSLLAGMVFYHGVEHRVR
jgi:peptidoglycan/LPS O-acetylase OafA/YrhL